MSSHPSRAFPKFESYGMPETVAFRGWKAQDAIEWFHGIGRLDGDGNVDFRACVSGSPRTPWFFSRHTGFEIVSRKGKVDKGQIVAYRVSLEVTFILE
jgi:hypothetical protein